MDASKQIREQVRLMKLENEKKRKLRDEVVEDLSGQETFRVVQEKKYAPLIKATTKAADDTSKELVSINDNLALQSVQLTEQRQAVEGYKTSADAVLENMVGLKQQAAIENVQTLLNDTILNDVDSIPPRILHFLATRDKDSLSIAYEDHKEPKGFYLGPYPLEAIGEHTITVNKKTYPTTDGVWKLLTTNSARLDPDEITELDFNFYARIMFETTHAATKDVNGKVVGKSSKSWKWKKLAKYGAAKGWLKSSERSKSTGDGLIRFIPSDMEYVVGKLYTTLGNIELGHTNIGKEDIFLTMEIIDTLKKSNHLSAVAYKKIYSLLISNLQKLDS